jgi:hypothetical protein
MTRKAVKWGWQCYWRLWAIKLWLSWWRCAFSRRREIRLVDYVLWWCCKYMW